MSRHRYAPAPDGKHCIECGFPAGNMRTHLLPSENPRPPKLRTRPPVNRGDAAPTGLDHPSTSFEASDSVAASKGMLRASLLGILAVGTYTCDELERLTGGLHASVSSAITTMLREGLVERITVEDGTLLTRPTRTGRQAAVLRATTLGRAKSEGEVAA